MKYVVAVSDQIGDQSMNLSSMLIPIQSLMVVKSTMSNQKSHVSYEMMELSDLQCSQT